MEWHQLPQNDLLLRSFLVGRFVTAAPEARGIINLKCAQNFGHYHFSKFSRGCCKSVLQQPFLCIKKPRRMAGLESEIIRDF